MHMTGLSISITSEVTTLKSDHTLLEERIDGGGIKSKEQFDSDRDAHIDFIQQYDEHKIYLVPHCFVADIKLLHVGYQ